jgi:hypothetical protein
MMENLEYWVKKVNEEFYERVYALPLTEK